MTTYTTPHSLPILETSDKIAASGDGLREDLNAISTSANTALETVKAVAVASETNAKAYADTQDEAYRVVDRALWRTEDDGHQAAAEATAAAYTDGKDTANRAAWAAADTAKLAEAAAYTDTKDTENRAAWAAADTVVLEDAKDYTDAEVSEDRTRLTSLEAVAPKVSNIALDTDGVPYYSPGSTQVHIIQDTDGTPYFIRFMSASLDTDGTPYFA